MTGRGVTIDIAVEADGWTALADPDVLFERAAFAVLAGTGLSLHPDAELSVLLTGDAEIRTLNKRWRNKDAPTNVLSFPAADSHRLHSSPMLGDIAMGFETVSREAVEEKKALCDHVSHLFVHGMLHIIGYDHLDDVQADAMERLEISILSRIGIANPYENTDLISTMAEDR